jgi:hypothetical protein
MIGILNGLIINKSELMPCKASYLIEGIRIRDIESGEDADISLIEAVDLIDSISGLGEILGMNTDTSTIEDIKNHKKIYVEAYEKSTSSIILNEKFEVVSKYVGSKLNVFGKNGEKLIYDNIKLFYAYFENRRDLSSLVIEYDLDSNSIRLNINSISLDTLERDEIDGKLIDGKLIDANWDLKGYIFKLYNVIDDKDFTSLLGCYYYKDSVDDYDSIIVPSDCRYFWASSFSIVSDKTVVFNKSIQKVDICLFFDLIVGNNNSRFYFSKETNPIIVYNFIYEIVGGKRNIKQLSLMAGNYYNSGKTSKADRITRAIELIQDFDGKVDYSLKYLVDRAKLAGITIELY